MKINMRGMLAIGMVVAMSLSACGSSTTTSTTAASTTEASSEVAGESAQESTGTFTVGFDQDFPPMGFVGEDGQFTGFDLDLAAEAASRMGREIVYQPIAWDSKDAELSAGTIDCIWNGFTIEGREDGYTWSEPYMANEQVFVVKAGSDIQSAADLAGKIVEVQADSSALEALEGNSELTGTFAQLLTVPDYNTALMDLEMGTVDAVAMDSTVANYKITTGGLDAVVLSDIISTEQYGVGFKLGNEALRDEVQAVLDEMAADGTMAAISQEWFGTDITILGK